MIGTKQIRWIKRGLNCLAVIASMVPLLGFTGTKTGMSKPFIVIEKSMSMNASMLVGGHLGSINHYSGGMAGGYTYFLENLKVGE